MQKTKIDRNTTDGFFQLVARGGKTVHHNLTFLVVLGGYVSVNQFNVLNYSMFVNRFFDKKIFY